jgi:hypothetical protein
MQANSIGESLLSETDRSLAQRFVDSCYDGKISPPDRSGLLRLAQLGLVAEVRTGIFVESPKMREAGF